MRGACDFDGDEASSGSMSTVSKGSAAAPPPPPAAVEKDYVEEQDVEEDKDEDEDEEELELGLSLGASRLGGGGGFAKGSARGEYCRILTAEDFPSLGARASPLSSSSSVSSSTVPMGGGRGGAAVAGGGGAVAGTKRAADAVSSPNPPSQMVVGWPPIRAFRMNSLVNQSKDSSSDVNVARKKNNSSTKEANVSKDQDKKGNPVGSSLFVKVNMDGDPIGRKVDLNAHLSYESLAVALEIMFPTPSSALSNSINGMKASKLLDGSSEFALTYEDKDGDWMLVGDVPWGMFLSTVKRLRIMRTSDANGLAPRFQSSNKVGRLIRS